MNQQDKQTPSKLNNIYNQPSELQHSQHPQRHQQDMDNSLIIDEPIQDQMQHIDAQDSNQQGNNDYIANQLFKLNEKTQQLHADEELLKEQLKVREQETLATFSSLMAKKKQLLELIKNNFNSKKMYIDISLQEELKELQKIINKQTNEIVHLKTEISKQGLAGVLNDESLLKIKTKADEIEKEIQVGRKFSSTQYVRDYLQRPQAYKVNYEQAKYEYQIRLRLKESLQQQKALYQSKKEQLCQLKKKEREFQQQLHKELDFLQK